MPEGPELKKSADQLNHHCKGKRLTHIKALGGRYKDKQPEGMESLLDAMARKGPLTVDSVWVKGKFMWWELHHKPYEGKRDMWSMWCTYGMTGQWSQMLTDHSSVMLTLDGPPTRLHFNDPRHFGTIKFAHEDPRDCIDPDHLGKKLKTLGPDMLSGPPFPETFIGRFRKHNDKQIAAVLLDQRVVSGVGNYIRAEALYRAHISPFREISTLTDSELADLRIAIILVMQESYTSGGATLSTYYSPDGERGSFKDRLRVYGRKEDPEGRPVRKDKAADGRAIWWVPAAQK